MDAGVALASELSFDAVLQRIVEAAAELTGARYAALGVIDPSGQSLEKFVVTGIDAETQAAIGTSSWPRDPRCADPRREASASTTFRRIRARSASPRTIRR